MDVPLRRSSHAIRSKTGMAAQRPGLPRPEIQPGPRMDLRRRPARAGVVVAAVRALPMSVTDNIDPEEALVAATSSCHMLFFLSLAAKRGHTVESYIDNAVGLLDKDADGRMAMTNITLRPQIVFGGEHWPDEEEIAAIHHEAHEKCYIANSLKTEITIEPAIEPDGSEELPEQSLG